MPKGKLNTAINIRGYLQVRLHFFQFSLLSAAYALVASLSSGMRYLLLNCESHATQEADTDDPSVQ